MKHEWKKQEKLVYLPKATPEIVDIPEYQFIVLSGAGNPNDELFGRYIETLYSLAYTTKMNLKRADDKPVGYHDWVVYPLEGVWDLAKGASPNKDGKLNKDDLTFQLMIRQPDFVTHDFFAQMVELTKLKRPSPLLDEIKLEKVTDGDCIQMMHVGSYDDEPASFQRMEEFAQQNGLTRFTKSHREIYLSDFRKVPTEKLRTVLRFRVKGQTESESTDITKP